MVAVEWVGLIANTKCISHLGIDQAGKYMKISIKRHLLNSDSGRNLPKTVSLKYCAHAVYAYQYKASMITHVSLT